MHIIDRYILKTHVGPYLFILSTITFICLTDFIIHYIDLFLDKGVDFLVVLEFFILSLGHMFALIIPMSVLPAVLMAFGQLSSNNEITALKASGVSLYRMITPVVIAAALLTVGLIYFHNHVLPESNHRLLNLRIDIGKMRPTLEIEENMFSNNVEGYTIYVREKNDETGKIKDVWITKTKKGENPTTIIATKGKMTFLEDKNIIRFDLEDGEIHEMPNPEDIDTYRKTKFKNLTINIQDQDRTLKRSERTQRGDREMSTSMMKDKIQEIKNSMTNVRGHMNRIAANPIKQFISLSESPPSGSPQEGTEKRPPDRQPGRRIRDKSSMKHKAENILHILENDFYLLESKTGQISRYGVEIHKKFSIPFACIIFVMFGAPLAIRSGKKGRAMSIGLSIVFFVVYYIFLIGGEKLADRGLLKPWLSMWLPNIIFLIASAFLIRATVRETSTINWGKLNILKWRNRENS
jgi:lipopolysaccharide export system permease protein